MLVVVEATVEGFRTPDFVAAEDEAATPQKMEDDPEAPPPPFSVEQGDEKRCRGDEADQGVPLQQRASAAAATDAATFFGMRRSERGLRRRR